jgi:hypothetical protein
MGILDMFRKKAKASGSAAGRAITPGDVIELYLQLVGTTKALESLASTYRIKLDDECETRITRILANTAQAAYALPDGPALLMSAEARRTEYEKMYLNGAAFSPDEGIGSWPSFFTVFSPKPCAASWDGSDPKANKAEFKEWLVKRGEQNQSLLEEWAGLFRRHIGDLPGLRI